MTPRDKLDAARLLVFKRHPYVASVLMSLRPIEKKGIGTLAVSAGWHLYYDPNLQWTNEVLAAVVYHEVNHVLRDHNGRRLTREPLAWNIAADAEINPDVQAAGWTLPPNGVFPKIKNLLAEEYYKNIELKEISPCCGSCSGNPAPFEEGESSPGVPQIVQETLRRQAAEAIRDAGDAPAGLKRWAAEHLAPPKVDWRRQFARYLRCAVADAMGAIDLTWRRPSRRGAGVSPCILPKLASPKLNIGIILDASGSMDGGPAKAARSEIFGVVKTVGPSIVYIADVRIAGSRKVASAKDIVELAETLGGTDMRTAVLEVQKLRRHNVLVLLTDGFTGWPAPGEVHCPLVVAVTPGGESPPDYIRSVRIDK
jgi:predicted metal-dependent peptidase